MAHTHRSCLIGGHHRLYISRDSYVTPLQRDLVPRGTVATRLIHRSLAAAGRTKLVRQAPRHRNPSTCEVKTIAALVESELGTSATTGTNAVLLPQDQNKSTPPPYTFTGHTWHQITAPREC